MSSASGAWCIGAKATHWHPSGPASPFPPGETKSRAVTSGKMVPGPKIGFDIDDIKAWPDRLLAGEEVVVTEKLHGTFCCVGLRRLERGAGPEAVASYQ